IYQNNISFSKLPSYTGVWKEKYELDGFKQLPAQTVNGVNYNVYLIEKEALFPTITGSLDVESAEISMNIVKQRTQRRRNSIFDDFFSSGRAELEQITVRAPNRKITVKPFPSNLPDNFTNFAGTLNMSAKLDKTDAKTNEGVKLTIILNGSGNIQTLKEPSFFISPDIEQYEPTVRSTINRKGNAINGRKIIEYVLVPRVEGQLKIGPIEFSYWNSSTNKLETLRENEMILNVTQGKTFASAPTGNGVSKKDVRQLDQDIRYIRSDSEEFQSINSNLLSSRIYQATYLLTILCYIGAYFYLNKRSKLASDVNLKRRKEAQGKVSRILKEAKTYHDQKDSSNFFQAINRAICQYIADKTAKDAAGFTSDSIRKTLSDKQIEDQLIKDVLAITEKCDFYRFANPNNPAEEMESIWDQSTEVLSKLTKAL
ncbi:MAG: protein BatD, partial [Calditrichaeota bacterium]|nr:protein BatD [Calditrichota bacterium]